MSREEIAALISLAIEDFLSDNEDFDPLEYDKYKDKWIKEWLDKKLETT